MTGEQRKLLEKFACEGCKSVTYCDMCAFQAEDCSYKCSFMDNRQYVGSNSEIEKRVKQLARAKLDDILRGIIESP